MTRGIIKVMTTLAITAVCGGCHNARETVEEAAAHADVSYELKDSEKEIINATNDFSFKLFQSLSDNNRDKDFIVSPLGVVYSLDIISNGASGHTKQQLQHQLGTSQYSLDDINALNGVSLCQAHLIDNRDSSLHTDLSQPLAHFVHLWLDLLLICFQFVKRFFARLSG